MHIQFAEIPVFDQERAKAFYIDHLNCRVVADQPMSNDGWRWIELGFRRRYRPPLPKAQGRSAI
jgi:catechol 2,3-dioxygenase-like lactoylglutathione lyase family enzyme